MNRHIFLIFCLAVSLTACSLATYTLVSPGTSMVGDLTISSSDSWNLSHATAYSRKKAQVWTQDGLLLDRLIIIPGVPDGESLFVSRQKDAALPKFRSDMLANEIQELSESSISKLFGEGEVAVSTMNLRPHRFGDNQGFMFDLNAILSDGPEYSGTAGAFVANEMLYFILYIAAEPYYFGKHLEEATTVIQTAHL